MTEAPIWVRICDHHGCVMTSPHNHGQPRIGARRACPDCGRPQHYTGLEYGWAHDALVDTWHCADPRKAGA